MGLISLFAGGPNSSVSRDRPNSSVSGHGSYAAVSKLALHIRTKQLKEYKEYNNSRQLDNEVYLK